MPQRLCLALLLLVLVPPATAQPASGTYRVRPAEVLACGGFVGDCRAMTLDGTLQLVATAPSDGGFATVEIASSDLYLRAADGSGGRFAFPAAEDVRLSELEDDPNTGEYLLVSVEGAPQTVELRLTDVSPGVVILEGTYDEGCCDRFVYRLGVVLLESQDGAPDDALVLGDGAFSVRVQWKDFFDNDGSGTPVKFDERSGSFWFFNAANPELLVKVLDGCTVNGHHWFFAAGLTNVEVEIRVTDDSPVPARTYENPLQQQFQPILDTTAFPCGGPST